MISDASDVYTHRMQENNMYLILLCSGMHRASVLSCSRSSIRQIGGGMHLLLSMDKSL